MLLRDMIRPPKPPPEPRQLNLFDKPQTKPPEPDKKPVDNHHHQV